MMRVLLVVKKICFFKTSKFSRLIGPAFSMIHSMETMPCLGEKYKIIKQHGRGENQREREFMPGTVGGSGGGEGGGEGGGYGGRWIVVLVTLSQLQSVAAPNTFHPREAPWGRLKRCDLIGAKSTFFDKAARWGKSDYLDGGWVPASVTRPSISAEVPMIGCNREGFSACPLGTCDDGAAASTDACERFHAACFGVPSATTGMVEGRPAKFREYVAGLHWAWLPQNGCHFSPLANLLASEGPTAGLEKLRNWASAVEAGAGPMLWVGDSHLEAQHVAFQALTKGAIHTDFHRADTLVNSYTLDPMPPALYQACVSSNGGSSGDASVPCPPTARSSTRWWEDNSHHQVPPDRTFEASRWPHVDVHGTSQLVIAAAPAPRGSRDLVLCSVCAAQALSLDHGVRGKGLPAQDVSLGRRQRVVAAIQLSKRVAGVRIARRHRRRACAAHCRLECAE